jgi:osmotically inducible lipoprotein OsmB
MSIFKLFATGILIATLGLSGCSGMAGNVLCGGVLCTGAGAVVGGVIGHEVTKDKK